MKNVKINKISPPDYKIENIISYFILDEKGTIILARQFSALSKSQLFYHAAYFYQYYKNLPKDKEENNSFIDNKDYRYVYFPLENNNLYSVLLVKTNYNIFNSLHIVKLIQRMITEITKNNCDNKGKVRIF